MLAFVGGTAVHQGAFVAQMVPITQEQYDRVLATILAENEAVGATAAVAVSHRPVRKWLRDAYSIPNSSRVEQPARIAQPAQQQRPAAAPAAESATARAATACSTNGGTRSY